MTVDDGINRNVKNPDDELNCGCGFIWAQFINAGIDELVNFCPCCGDAV